MRAGTFGNRRRKADWAEKPICPSAADSADSVRDSTEGTMHEPDLFKTPQGRELAYHRTPGDSPGIIFLGGFMSDMDGTKARYLEDWARQTGRGFLRFDYSGHGQSSGRFEEGSIGIWAEDAMQVMDHLSQGPQILVGSSMGGWIALLLAKSRPERIAGLVTVAAAPDFTEDSMLAGFDTAQRAALEADGVVYLPSDYGDPYPVTRNLIENGRRHLVLRDRLDLEFPVRFLQGTDDEDVDKSVAMTLLEHATGADMTLTMVKGADHRFSDDTCLELIRSSVEEVIARTGIQR